MKIIVSPAKKMRTEEYVEARSKPLFSLDAAAVLSALRSLSREERARVWKVEGKLLSSSSSLIDSLDIEKAFSPALFSYDGIQYTYMSPSSFTDRMLCYAGERLRIISGLYGLLRPLDAIGSYRLEMASPLAVEGFRDLYSFWGSRIADALMEGDGTIVNLASAEYSKAVLPYIGRSVRVVTPVFLSEKDGRRSVKSVNAKMERGSMVRWMAENSVDDMEDLKEYSSRGYVFSPSLSDSCVFSFVRREV